MESQVLYRKWRPQTLSEVAGQEHVTRTLKNALERGRIAHAYLFCGPRGTGKTSTGRILAKAVNCLGGGHGEPCNTCTMCQSVTSGSALDVIEIDAASNRGIDDIRDLREKVNFAPGQARHKVYIVDEVHMLTEAASNALLKTLEEPPPYVIFVLATTEPHKLLATILSRCQRYDFRRLTQAAISARLAHICASEEFQVQPEALNLIARSAAGSLRDAVNLLEQMVTYFGHRVELPQVQAKLGLTGDLRTRELARHIMAGDTQAALRTLHSVMDDGRDLKQFQRELVEYMRQLLLVKCGAPAAVDATPEDIAEMQATASTAAPDHVLESVKLISAVDFRLDSYSALPLEMAIVECGLAREARPAPVDARRKATVATPRPGSAPAQPAAPEPSPPRAAASPAAGPGTIPAGAGQPEAAVPAAVRSSGPPSDWDKVLRAVKAANKNAEAVLKSCEPALSDDGVATLRISYAFYRDKIEEHRKTIEDCMARALGKQYRIVCVLQPREKKQEQTTGPQGHLVKAALQMGAKIVSTEEKQ